MTKPLLSLESEARDLKRKIDALDDDMRAFKTKYPSATNERGLFEKQRNQLAGRLAEIEREIAQREATPK